MLRWLSGLALAAALAAPALAQRHQPPTPSPYQQELERKKKEAETVDRDYKAAMERTNKSVAPTTVDPWQNMRGPSETNR